MALGLTRPLTEMITRTFWGGGVICGRIVSLTDSPPAVSQLSERCGMLDISQLYGSQQPLIGIFLLFTI
jgi:hypothetical protein